MPRKYLAWLPAIAWMAFIFALSANPHPPVPHAGNELLDLILRKLGHFSEYAVLALLFYHPLQSRPRAAVIALLLCALFAATDEWHQTFVPGRDGNIRDVLIDSSGAGLALVFRVRFSRGQWIERSMDLLGGLLGLGVLMLLTPPIVLAIKLDSRGPVFFTQWRAGKDGRPFKIYKFRSMIDGAELMLDQVIVGRDLASPVLKIPDDPRITRVGRVLRRFSLDELPQFLNVLKGEMSLVGPRPEELRITALYDKNQQRRLAVKPGMTGPMQVRGRARLTLEERVQMELDYIEHKSLGRDAALLARTVIAVIKGQGAF